MDTHDPIRAETVPRDRSGFSIVELLVVVSFLAILASIAIPRFTSVTDRSFEAAVKSDLRNAFAAQEVYFEQYGEYKAFEIDPGGSLDEPKIQASPGVSITATTSGGSSFELVGSHQSLTSSTWCLSSEGGALVEGDDC